MSDHRPAPGPRRSVEREIEDEIAFHIASRVRALVAEGLSQDDAQRRAEQEFGDLEASRSELATVDRRHRRRQRAGQMLEAIGQDLRYALRALRRAPAFTSTVLVTLTVGIGACVAIFAVVDGILLKPLPYGDPSRLVGAWYDMPAIGLYHEPQSASTYLAIQRLSHTIDGMGLYDETAVNVAAPGGAGDPQRVTAAFVTATLLPVLRVSPALGRNFTAAEDAPGGPPAVIIAERLWRAGYGGDTAVIGKTLDVNGTSRRVVGVMPQSFHFPSAATELWLPLQLDPVRLDQNAFSHSAIARLKAGVTVADARRDFAAILPRVAELYPNFVTGISTRQIMAQAKPIVVLVPMHDDVTGGIAATLWTIAASAALVLLVACANVANLMLVRGDARQRELQLRDALGAGRARIAMHFVAESALLAAVAGVAGLAVATAVIHWLVTAGPSRLPRLTEVGVDWRVALCALAAVVFVTLVCAAAPTLRALRVRGSLEHGSRRGTSGRSQQRLRGALVAAQLALTLVVLAGSGLLIRTFVSLRAIQPGFDPRHVAMFWVSLPRPRYNDSSRVRFFTSLVDQASHLPGVESAALASRIPLLNYGSNQNPLYPEDDASFATKLPPLQMFVTIGNDYFGVMHIPIIAGHGFAPMGAQREGDAVISRKTAAFFWKDSTGHLALGKRFRALPGAPLYTVVGVVADVRDSSLALPPVPMVYFPDVLGPDSMTGQARRTLALLIRSNSDQPGLDAAVRRIVHDLDPVLPIFDVRRLDDIVATSTAQLTFVLAILGSAAIITLLLGAVGLYGVLAYVVTLRTRELGIRIALGATPSGVAAALTRYGLRLALAGLVAGLVVFAGVARFIRSLLYGVGAGDPLTLIAASVLLIVIAALASWLPARSAAKVDPAIALRAD